MFKLIVAASVLALAYSKIQCPENQIYDRCGTYCPPDCVNMGKQVKCVKKCKIGCRCIDGLMTVRDQAGNIDCIPKEECPGQIQDCIAPLVWNMCGSPCNWTCQNPVGPCTKPCVQRCQCPDGAPLQDIDYNGQLRCSSLKECCPEGKVYHPCPPKSCPYTCDPDNSKVNCLTSVCSPRCVCPREAPIELTDAEGNFLKCVAKEDCPR